MGKIRIEAISFFWKSLKKPLICGLVLLYGLWLVHNTGHAEETQVSFDPESYVGQMLTLFKTSELMEDIWIDYIQKRAAVYRETADQMDRYPMLANLDYVGKAHDYSYDFLAMQGSAVNATGNCFRLARIRRGRIRNMISRLRHSRPASACFTPKSGKPWSI